MLQLNCAFGIPEGRIWPSSHSQMQRLLRDPETLLIRGKVKAVLSSPWNLASPRTQDTSYRSYLGRSRNWVGRFDMTCGVCRPTTRMLYTKYWRGRVSDFLLIRLKHFAKLQSLTSSPSHHDHVVVAPKSLYLGLVAGFYANLPAFGNNGCSDSIAEASTFPQPISSRKVS